MNKARNDENGFRNAVESRNRNVLLYACLTRLSENDVGFFYETRRTYSIIVSDAVC